MINIIGIIGIESIITMRNMINIIKNQKYQKNNISIKIILDQDQGHRVHINPIHNHHKSPIISIIMITIKNTRKNTPYQTPKNTKIS